jgi:hypothetical protein
MTDPTAYSGKFNLRLPTDLHRALAERAEREGVSLNTAAVAFIAGGLGYRKSLTRDVIPKETWERKSGQELTFAKPTKRNGTSADLHNFLLERAEDAAVAGLPLDDALQAVREGYSSIEADKETAKDLDLSA